MQIRKLNTNRIKTNKLKTNKLITSKHSSGGAGICPMKLPVVPTAGPLGLSDVNVVINGQTFEMTSTDAVNQGQALYQSEVLYVTGGERAAYEITMGNASALDFANIFAFGLGIFGGTFGYNMAPADLVNGILQEAQTNSDLINPWANPVTPLVFQLQLDGVAGEMTLIGPDGSVVWTLSGGIYTQVLQNAQLYYFFGGVSPAGVGETFNFTVNAGNQAFVHPLPAGYKAFCELATLNASYFVFGFFPTNGDAGVEADGRTVYLTNDGVDTPQFTGSLGYAALTVPVAYDWNVYEQEVTQLDAGVADNYWRMGFVGFISTQGGHAFQNGNSYVLETYYSLGNLTATQCFNNVALSVGDSMAVVVKNRRESEGPLLVRPYYNIAGETCLFDAIEVPPSGNGEDYVPNFQMESQNSLPLGTAKFIFNGESGDYAGTYVDTFKDIQGNAIAGAIPEVRQSWFENLTVYTPGGTLPTITNSNTRLTVANASGSDETAQTHSRTLANLNDGQIVAAVQLVTLAAANNFKFAFEGVNTDNSSSEFGIEYDGADYVITSNNDGTIEAPQVILAATTVQAGDELGIVFDPDNSRAKGILVRGASAFISGWIAVDTLFSGTVYMPRFDTGIVANGETSVTDCQYKADNMSATMRINTAGADDLEGTPA